MEDQNTNFDILDLISKENNNHYIELLNTKEKEIINSNNHLGFDILGNLYDQENQSKEEDISESIGKIYNNDIISSPKIEKISLAKTLGNIFIFLLKYISTSSLIFLFLLSVSNYHAYIEIARSYLNPELLEQNKLSLLSSVSGANIIGENKIENESLVKDTIVQKVSMVKNKTFHSMDKLLSGVYDENLNMNIEIVPYENRVIIPKLGKNIPLIDVKSKTVQNVKELEDVFMTELENGIVRYPGSAKPGDLGNSFIFGHSSNFPWIKGDYNDVFALLDNVVFGDEIIAYYDQKKYVFKIREKKIIKPGDISILKRNTKKPEISLMTCWPVGTTLNRMVVIGELVE